MTSDRRHAPAKPVSPDRLGRTGPYTTPIHIVAALAALPQRDRSEPGITGRLNPRQRRRDRVRQDGLETCAKCASANTTYKTAWNISVPHGFARGTAPPWVGETR